MAPRTAPVHDDPPPLRVAIVLMSALGDVTLGLPVAMAIRRAWPATHLTWIAQRGPDALVRAHPAIDDVLLFDRRGGLGGYLAIRRDLRARPFDLVLDLQTALKAGLVTACTRAPVKWGIDRQRARDANWLFTTHRVPSRPRAHMADQFQEFLAPLDIAPAPLAYGLAPTAAGRARAETWLEDADDTPLVAVVVASSAADKNWAPERLATCCEALATDFGLRPLLVGGPTATERAIADVIRARTRGLPPTQRPIDALGSGIPALVALLDRAALVISPDSGPLHMAVALDRPVIGLYGPTNPKWVGPYRDSHDLLVDRYGDPGESYVASADRRPGRMARITVDDVLDRVAHWCATRRAAFPPVLTAASPVRPDTPPRYAPPFAPA
jgi:heptosyltransferase I